ncbi:DNA translocase FtsK [Parasporobacterium paucivorans]|uniref:DNA translocase FtsK n=1 Tax=Parasporobacterium paucivorans DSM 15970 TaxID=1122934 RepID=A0A1M6ET82_9FIRM|nr:DNA translocase FtsK [Parasporobacterium paucivorans]SHI88579.1 DNA translocase FtsK [Parasporobacterium paucivorans DSM 15970]
MTASKKNLNKKKKSRTKPEASSGFVEKEIKLLLLFAITVILELSIFGFGGKAGGYLAYFLFGLFGFLAYIFPIILLLGVLFLVSNKSSRKSKLKFAAGTVLFLAVCSLIQLIFNVFNPETQASGYYALSAENRTGGGLIGGLAVKGLSLIVGTAGAYVVLIALCIICVVVLTEKSFIGGIQKSSSKVYNSAKDDVIKIKEQREKAAMEKIPRVARIEKKVRGVQKDLKLTDNPDAGDDVHEITPDDFMNGLSVENTEIRQRDASKIQEPERNQAVQKTEPKKVEEHKTDTENPTEFSPPQDMDDSDYVYPPLSLLAKPSHKKRSGNENSLSQTAMKLQQTLETFGVNVTITNYSQGPSVTRYELQPEMGTKVSRITSLADDIKLNLAVSDIRIEAPIPGKAAVGIEIPNDGSETVYLRELLESKELAGNKSRIAFAAGKDISGMVVVTDIAKMPHMLVAGTTGSGKSVFMNSIIMTILFRTKPSEVKLIIIDPKVVEFGVYNGIPHLLSPVVTDPKMASSVLNWAVAEMTRRYKLLAEYNVRDFKSYNNKVDEIKIETGEILEKLPQILIIIDELADLMMVAAKAVEDSICRLAQLARAAGIHLIIATQRPSVDVVTGLIKANIPSRVALMVSSGTDSRTILDMNGAEKLLGNGDMLFYPSGYVKPVRVQGAFVSEEEVSKTVEFLKENGEKANYDNAVREHIQEEASLSENPSRQENIRDEYFEEAGKLVIEKEKASASMLQRRFNIGFNRAARIIDQMEDLGVVGAEEGPKPRKVLLSLEEFEQLREDDIRKGQENED